MSRTSTAGWRGLVGEWFQSRRSHRRTKHRLAKAVIEVLEPRVLLSNTVTNANDSGVGSLRAEIQAAETAGGNETISFAPTLAGSTINLNSTLLLNDTTGTLTIDGTTAGSVTVKEQGTGGVFDVRTSSVLEGLTITGGNENGGIQATAPLVVTSCSIVGNPSAGIRDIRAGALTINNSTISGNTSSRSGGGIYVSYSGAVTIMNSTISGNTSSYGGGIFTYGNSSVTISNSTISGNSATNGGGIYAYGAETIIDSTIANNLASGAGAGIRTTSGTTTLSGTIVAKNRIGSTENDLSGTGFTGTYNLIGDGSGGLTDPSNKTGNPNLSALAYFGGPTQTMALLSGSPALGHGFGTSSITTDQRGLARPTSSPDIGAFQSNNLVVNTASDAPNGPLAAGVLSLRQAVSLANTVGGNETISFAPTLAGSTINLNNTLLLNDTTGTLTIDGTTAGSVTVKQLGTGEVFDVRTSSVLKGLTITGGNENGGIQATAPLVVSSCSIVGNSSPGIRDIRAGALTISNSKISGNTSSGSGGGIYVSYSGAVTIMNSTISGNTSSYGGGIFTYGNSSVTISNSTISGNSAVGGYGGGIYDYGSLTITDTTIAGNSSTHAGAGIRIFAGTPTLSGTIVADNMVGGTEGDLSANGGGFTGTNNLIGDGSGGLSTSDNNILDVSPLLAPLGNYGGPTQTMALLPGSPAIGKGAIFDGIMGDQRGYVLPSGVTPDIGSFQSKAIPGPGVVTVSPIVINPTSPTVGSPARFSVTASVVSHPSDTLNYTWTLVNSSTPNAPLTFLTSQPNISYTPVTAGNYTASVTVTDVTNPNSSTVGPQKFTIAVESPLAISGPGVVNDNQSANYTVTGLYASSATWSVIYGSTTTPGPSGSAFTFAPTQTGAYAIEATATSGGHTYTATESVNVPYVAPTVSISGPSIGFVGKSFTFAADVTQNSGSPSDLSFTWQILNSEGGPYSGITGLTTSQSTFVVPGTLTGGANALPAGSYSVKVSVTDSGNPLAPAVTADFQFAVLAAPPPGLSYGTIPAFENETDDDIDYSSAIAFAVQTDGKIVVVGDAVPEDPNYGGAYGGWIARFNPDLSLDTTFGPEHSGIVSLDEDFEPNPSPIPYFGKIQSVLINPVNQDIIVVGSGPLVYGYVSEAPGYTQGIFQVAAFLSKETVEADGTLLAPGQVDPNFGTMGTFQLPGTMTSTERAFAFDAIAPNDGSDSIYVGGTVDYGTTDQYGFFSATQSDFLLLKLSATGQLDWTVNQPDMFGDFGDSTLDPPQMTSLAYDSTTHDIYVGGIGSDPSDPTSPNESFVLARYNTLNGTLDTSFGNQGVVYTDSAAFSVPVDTNGTITEVPALAAVLSSIEVLPDGNVLAVGEANSQSPGTAYVVLAEYQPTVNAQGSFSDLSFGNRGIVNTDINFNSTDTLGGLTPATVPGEFPGSFAFELEPGTGTPDGKIIASLQTASGSELVRFTGDDGVPADAGQLDLTFGPNGTGAVSIASPSADATFASGSNPGDLLLTSEGILVTGQAAFRETIGPGQAIQAEQVPMLFQYVPGAPNPAVNDLSVAQAYTGAVYLTWNVQNPGQAGFYVERNTSLNDGSMPAGSIIAQVGPDQLDYSDTTALPGQTYYYEVVPFLASDVPITSGTANPPPSIITAPVPTPNDYLQEAIQVPLNGGPVTSTSILSSSNLYRIVVTGSFDLTSGLLGDAAYFYTTADTYYADYPFDPAPGSYGPESINPYVTGANLFSQVGSATTNFATDQTYGIELGNAGASGPMAMQDWGGPNTDNHTYSIIMRGTGAALTAELSGAAALQANSKFSTGSSTLEVDIYELSGSATAAPVSSQSGNGQPTLEISVPSAAHGVDFPILSASSAIDLLAAESGVNVPWTLLLTSASGVVVHQWNGLTSIGSLPNTTAFEDTLNALGYPAGVYTLKLSSNFTAGQNYSTSLQILLAAPVLKITSINTASDGVTPVIEGNTPISVLSASPDGSPAPWSLNLISQTSGVDTLLASSSQSIGQLPDAGTVVVTLNPSLYPNGTFTLQLTSPISGVATDTRTITIATAVKTGSLTLPVTDATLNTVTGTVAITRTYDSGHVTVPAPVTPPSVPSDVNPDYNYGETAYVPNFGPGWSLGLLDSQLSISGQADTINYPYQSTPILRAGDLVYLTVPDVGRQAFEFDPIPIDNALVPLASQSSVEYQANFLAVDGSGATLKITYPYELNLATFSPAFDDWSPGLVNYDPQTNEFVYSGPVLNEVEDPNSPTGISGNYLSSDPNFGFSAAYESYENINGDPGYMDVFGGAYQVTEKDGTSYTIDAATGAIDAVSNPSGATTLYTYAPGSVVATDPQGNTLFTITSDPSNHNRITQISVNGQNSIDYFYNAAGYLTSVQGQNQQTTLYSYQQLGNNYSYLTGITGPNGQNILQAQYDSATQQLQELVNADGVSIPVSSQGLGAGDVLQTVVDAAGDITENVYDEKYGTLLRSIKAQTDTSGNVLDYLVSVTNFSYVTDDVGQVSDLRPNGEQILQEIQTYQSFEVTAANAQDRFSEMPASDTLTSQTIFDTVNNSADPASGQIISSSQQVSSPSDVEGEVLKTTLNQNYRVVNTTTGEVQPTLVTVEIQRPDADTFTGYDNDVQSQTYYTYDSNGNLQYSLTPVAREAGGLYDTSIGTFADVGEGDYPSILYMSLSGFSVSQVNSTGSAAVAQLLTWNAAASAYEWSTSSSKGTLSITLQDTSLPANSPGGPQANDHWSLTVTDPGAWNGTGYGITLTEHTPVTDQSSDGSSGQIFDGGVAGFAALLADFFTSNDNDGYNYENALNISTFGWVAEGTQTSYNGNGQVASAGTAHAIITPNGTVESQASVTTSTDNYYGSNGVGAIDGDLQDSYNAITGQETYYAYDTSGRTVLTFTHKTWTAFNGTADVPYSGWVGTINDYDPTTGLLTDTYSATYLDLSGTQQALPVAIVTGSNGVNSVQVNTDTSSGGDSLYTIHENSTTSVSSLVRTAHYDYNSAGQKIDSIDQYGGETTYTYDANGNLIETVNPDGTESLTVYDALNRAIWTTNNFLPSQPSSVIATFTDYNQLGQVIETDQYQGTVISLTAQGAGSTAAFETTESSAGTLITATKTYYDPAGKAIETISPNAITGAGSTATINSTGLRTGTIYYPDGSVEYTGPLNSSAPNGGNSSTGEYQPSDFLFYTTTEPSLYNQSTGMFHTRTIDQNDNATDSYTDAEGRTVRVVNSDGSFTETLYSVGGQDVSTDQEGDTLAQPQGIASGGSETVTIAQRKAGDPPVATYDFYNASGELTDVYEPPVLDGNPSDSAYGTTTMVTPHWTYQYDQSGDETAEISPNEQSGGQFAGYDTTFAYDQNGNQVSETLPESTSAHPEVSYTSYNQYNQEDTHIDFDGNVASYSYYTGYNDDGYAGSLAEVEYSGSTDHASQSVSYKYTPLGQEYQVNQTIDESNNLTTYSYDFFGNEIQAETPEGTINYVFDPVTQLHTETWTEPSGSNNKSEATSTGTVLTDIYYGYNNQGRLESVSQAVLNGVTQSGPSATRYGPGGASISTTYPTTIYTYDNNGNLLSESDPNGDTTTYTYDSLNRLTSETVTNSSNVTVFSESITIGDNGLRTAVEDKQYTSGSLTSDTTTTYTYDNDGRLTSQTMSLAGSGLQYGDSYTYDLDNNRMTDVHTGALGGSAGTTTYAYNGDDENTSSTLTVGAENTITSNTYDANGSLTNSSTTGVSTPTTYTYDARNKMVGYSGPSGSATYVYDDYGNRVQETTGGTTTDYLTDTQNPTGYDQPIEQRLSATGSPQVTYVLGNRVVAQATSSGTSYLLADGHGSTRALTNSSGAVIASDAPNTSGWFTYDSFGGAIGNWSLASAGTGFLFGGDAVYDPASGLYMNGDGMRDRLGFEFIQMDSSSGNNQDPISLHKYLYANGDPINGNDPSGHDDDTLSDEAFDLAGEYQAEELTGLQDVENYVGENDWAVNASYGLEFAAAGIGANGSSDGFSIQSLEAELQQYAPSAVDIDFSLSGNIPFFAGFGVSLGAALSWEVDLDKPEVDLNLAGSITGSWGGAGFGAAIGFGVSFGDPASGFQYAIEAPLDLLNEQGRQILTTALSSNLEVAAHSMIQTDPGDVNLWTGLSYYLQQTLAYLPEESFVFTHPFSGSGFELALEGGASLGDSGTFFASVEYDTTIHKFND